MMDDYKKERKVTHSKQHKRENELAELTSNVFFFLFLSSPFVIVYLFLFFFLEKIHVRNITVVSLTDFV